MYVITVKSVQYFFSVYKAPKNKSLVLCIRYERSYTEVVRIHTEKLISCGGVKVTYKAHNLMLGVRFPPAQPSIDKKWGYGIVG